jgi:hypothetical protein
MHKQKTVVQCSREMRIAAKPIQKTLKVHSPETEARADKE